MSEVVQVSYLGLPGIVLLAGPGVESLDLVGPRLVLGVIFLINLVKVVNPGLVILLGSLLQRFDLILPANTLFLTRTAPTLLPPYLRSFSLVAEFSNEL